jgi:hypothetical protein
VDELLYVACLVKAGVAESVWVWGQSCVQAQIGEERQLFYDIVLYLSGSKSIIYARYEVSGVAEGEGDEIRMRDHDDM